MIPLRSLHWYEYVGRSAANTLPPAAHRTPKGRSVTVNDSLAVASVISPFPSATLNSAREKPLTSRRSWPSHGTSTFPGATIHVRGSFSVSFRRKRTRTRSPASTNIRHCQPDSRSKRTQSGKRAAKLALTRGRILAKRERRLGFGGGEDVRIDHRQVHRDLLAACVPDLARRMHR